MTILRSCSDVSTDCETVVIFTCLFWFTFVLILNVKFRLSLLVFNVFIQLFEVWSKGTPVFLRDDSRLDHNPTDTTR